MPTKNYFLNMFFADYGTYFLKVHLIFKDKKSSVEIKVFSAFLLHDGRIRFCKNNDGSDPKSPKTNGSYEFGSGFTTLPFRSDFWLSKAQSEVCRFIDLASSIKLEQDNE
jgi:hypothetical protein